ncbi:MAG TPA: hypothetical protein VK669_07795 [Candidatus Limnocylindrales bacterium]|nr:hypothetical protein [Candidatus Limnocylindrales bacterium]
MTIMAAHFGITLGIWRVRLRIDIDEPRESELRDEPVPQPPVMPAAAPSAEPQRTATWGRG